MHVVRPPFGNPATSVFGGPWLCVPASRRVCPFVNGGNCTRSSRIAPSGCTAIDPTPLLLNNSHLEILNVLRYYQSLKTDTWAIRHISSNPSRNLARTRPKHSAMSSIADAQEQHSRRLPAAASAEQTEILGSNPTGFGPKISGECPSPPTSPTFLGRP